MTDWSSGYVTDIQYIYGYYPELNPLRVKLALLHRGIVAPTIKTACELGYGQGLSVNFHAAASGIGWAGTDFNPAQAGFAQQLASVSGSTAQLYDQSFEEFCNRTDLPEFDYVGLHGIWSWISDANRAMIVEFIRRKLRLGGVLYISYNTQPGWAAMLPMRELLIQHSEIMGSGEHGIVGKIDGALEFAEALLNINPRFALDNPQIVTRLKSLKNQNRNYLAHEYFNRDWQPMSFASMQQWLSAAKIQFACSAHYPDLVDRINLTNEQQVFLNTLPQGTLRQTVRDFCVNQPFRRDYWIKGLRNLSPLEKREQLTQIVVVLTESREGLIPNIVGSLGEATIQSSIYEPLLDWLADNKPRKVMQLLEKAKVHQINAAQVLQAVILLCGSGALKIAQDDVEVQNARIKTGALNTFLMQKARSNGEISYLASPVTGGGISVPRFDQLFLLAYQHRKQTKFITADDLAQFAWQILSTQGQRLIKEGKTLETAEANLTELTTSAEKFLSKHLPVYQALQII